MDERTAGQQIDAMIQLTTGWRGATLAHLRAIILAAAPNVVEEVKWKKPSRPEGVPVWSYDGIICVADTLKLAVRLTFPKGAQLPDPLRLFNARLDSKMVRAIDVHAGDSVDVAALTDLVRAAIELNRSTAR